MNPNLDEFLEELGEQPEFRHVKAESAIGGGNVIGVSGDIVGEEAMDALVTLGRKHGFIVFSDSISVWKSQEFLDSCGAGRATELE